MAGEAEISPVHFLLGVLKVVDPGFIRSLAELDVPDEAVREIKAQSRESLKLIGKSSLWVMQTRRSLRERCRKNGGQETKPAMLHRSATSRELFRRATDEALAAREDSLTLVHLLSALLADLPEAARPFLGDIQISPAQIEEPQSPANQANQAEGHIRGQTGIKNSTSEIELLGRDLTALARKGRLQEAIGRNEEMKTIARHLQRTSKRNVLMIGEAGVGKTAILEGLACRFAHPDAPDFLKKIRIVQVNLADIVAGTTFRGDLEKRLQALVKEVCDDPDIVLFLDEIHLAVGGGVGGTMDIANILKPALAREEFRCVGATTTEEYERHIKKDSAFLRRFQLLRVNEPSQEDAIQIAQAWAKRIEAKQGITFEPTAPQDAVALSAKWIRNRQLPDKAIDLLENAATFVKVTSLSFKKTLPSKQFPLVGKQQLVAVLEEQWGIHVDSTKHWDAKWLAESLSSEVLGQEKAITQISEALANAAELQEERPKPRAVLLFTGPTGTGKTFTAEVLAKKLFDGQAGRLGRFNMGEYKERHELSRLIGAPPGFIGHDQPGSLFRFMEQWPEGVILLDEMEKAHPEIQDYFLQISDRGETLDSRGRKQDFRPYVFIMTTNIASAETKNLIGFHGTPTADNFSVAPPAPTQFFRQEFLARIDAVVPFQRIEARAFSQALERWLGRLSDTLGFQVRLINAQDFADWCAHTNGLFRDFYRVLELALTPRARDANAKTLKPLHLFRWESRTESFVEVNGSQ
jgi:ATP-dependent Clp protease ATP-binding subunit ClpA